MSALCWEELERDASASLRLPKPYWREPTNTKLLATALVVVAERRTREVPATEEVMK